MMVEINVVSPNSGIFHCSSHRLLDEFDGIVFASLSSPNSLRCAICFE